ncbi:hypothetical protein Rhe02_04000 [Rhizocola hellebori]|uniref:Fumarate lyase N-terminal domain-containing protein n=1 Tax=Rhizocola hellebori TaxID=1392758 RepID=A0A8J3Q2P7_9ACTN|nr:hypothetical protein Rhe02_04000 [Rhizocola hellebori]
MRDAVSDEAWLQALLDAEAALAAVQADEGLIPQAHATAIAQLCHAEQFDISDLANAAAGMSDHDADPAGSGEPGAGTGAAGKPAADAGPPGNPVLPLVRALRARLTEEVAASVHFGATSQDILDTAGMLVAHRALGALLADLDSAAEAAARLAREHRATPMTGRTLLQLAEPVTFGMTAAGWLVALDEAAAWLREVRRARLAVQLGGPVGRLIGYQGKYAQKLGLATPLLSWHTNRLRVAELAAALGGAAGVVGKVARDITLLAQSEVAEVSEAAPGASSAMAHKRNPIAAIMAVSCAMQAPGLVATLLAAMIQEHGRAAGAWHAEFRAQRELLTSTGSAAAWLRASLDGLRVHDDAMAANLALLATSDVQTAHTATALVDRALLAHETREGQ